MARWLSMPDTDFDHTMPGAPKAIRFASRQL
jgi:hypothetical protein